MPSTGTVSALLIQRRHAIATARRLIKSRTPFIVIGIPGVGKTRFVSDLVYQPETPFVVEWVNLPSSADPVININLSLALLREHRPTQEMIVVLDGAEPLRKTDLADAIRRYKNYKLVRTVIVTSQRSFKIRGVREIQLHYSPEQLYRLAEQVHFVPHNRIIKLAAPTIVAANDALIEKLKHQPTDLFKITPRQFEEVIADLLTDMGMEVELTPQTRDGGKDILAYIDTELGKLLCLVEAKQHRETRPVGVSLVRGLYGTVVDHDASKGMLVTTSRFTKDAHAFQQKHEYVLSLKDYSDVLSWILKYKQY